MIITRADVDQAVRAFLQAHLDDILPTAPPCSQHALAIDQFRRPRIRLWVGHQDGDVVGTAALAPVDGANGRHEELKSMRTDPERRGQGIASMLSTHGRTPPIAGSSGSHWRPGAWTSLPQPERCIDVTGSPSALRSATTRPIRTAPS
ncbi:MAG: GNAT family N-acetyltransferase [Propionibacteriales bacterium]|nr:GNAT family N-acetyltransferase [Propionibacteriales bacterium]